MLLYLLKSSDFPRETVFLLSVTLYIESVRNFAHANSATKVLHDVPVIKSLTDTLIDRMEFSVV